MKQLSCLLVAFAALLISVRPVRAQVVERPLSSISSLERRAGQFERREDSRQRRRVLKEAAPAKPESVFLARLVPSIESTDSATKFAPSVHFVQQPADGLGAFTLRAGLQTQRPRDIAKSRSIGGGIGADLQVTRDENPFGVLVVSGDFGMVKDGYQLGIGTVEFDRNMGERVTAIGTLSFARLSPNEGDAVSDVIPGVALQVSDIGLAGAALLGEYSFKNDLDEEDSYAFSVRFKLSDTSSLKVGAGKHGRVFASFVQVLKK